MHSPKSERLVKVASELLSDSEWKNTGESGHIRRALERILMMAPWWNVDVIEMHAVMVELARRFPQYASDLALPRFPAHDPRSLLF